MRKSLSIGHRILLLLPAAIAFWLLTSLARLLGGRLSAVHPVNWVTDPTQLPMPATLIVFLIFLVIGSWIGTAIMGTGCTLGAAISGWAGNLPVDYSHGYPLNYRGSYINSGMVELAFAMGSILLAILITLAVSGFRKWKERAACRKEFPHPELIDGKES